MIKADRDCASAAAASVIAKVARDALMTELHDELPAYNWARNKGYASPDHREAIVAARPQPAPPRVVGDRRLADAVLTDRGRGIRSAVERQLLGEVEVAP